MAIDVLPMYGQIEIGDRDVIEFPQWELARNLLLPTKPRCVWQPGPTQKEMSG